MASTGEFPGIEPTRELYYDPGDIANTVLWPLVDEIWGGDWREKSFPGAHFSHPQRDTDREPVIDVHLIAVASRMHEDEAWDDDEPRLFTEVMLDIETIATDPLREVIISTAQADCPKQMETSNPEYLTAKVSHFYKFNNMGGAVIRVCQLVEDGDGDKVWSSDAAEVSVADDFRFRGHDLDEIGMAVEILAPFTEHVDVLKAIRNRPTEAY